MKLQKRLDQYAKFLNTLPDGAILVDQDGSIALANEPAYGLFGYQSGELEGKQVHTLVPEPLRAGHALQVNDFMAAPSRRPMGFGLKLQARCADGRQVPVDIMLSPLRLGGRSFTACIVRDMSARLRLEADLEAALEREKALARTDHLTGAANARLFEERLKSEIDRCSRYRRPFSIAYFDLDQFKRVNDSLGHQTGDRLLGRVVDIASELSRRTDTIARLGGDEFALLLPEADEPAARSAVSKMRQALLGEMRKNDWPVTFSIGALTCTQPPETAQALIDAADRLMYAVKKAGRDGIRHGTFPD